MELTELDIIKPEIPIFIEILQIIFDCMLFGF